MSEDGWIPHDGGPCPVGRFTDVAVRFRDGTEDDQMRAGDWSDETPEHGLPNGPDFWRWQGQKDSHIIAYRIVEDTNG